MTCGAKRSKLFLDFRPDFHYTNSMKEKGKSEKETKLNYVSRMEDLESRNEESGGGFWKENEVGEWVEQKEEEE